MQVSAVLVALTALSALVTATIAAWAFGRRDRVPVARSFTVIVVAQTVWALFHLGEVLAQTTAGKLWWDSLQNLPYALFPALYLLTAHRFATVKPPRGLVTGVAVVAGVCALVLATVPVHGLARGDAHLIGTPPNLTYAFGGWDVGLVGAVFVASIVSAFVVLRRSSRAHPLYATQGVVFAIALLVPVLATVTALSLDLDIDGDRDVTPVTFMLGSVAAAWGIGRRGLFDIGPVARDAVLVRLPDPVLVFDHGGHVVDANPAALDLLGAAMGDVIGRPAAEVLTGFPVLRDLARDTGADGGAGDHAEPGRRAELCHRGRHGVCWYEAVHSPLTDSGGHALGATLILRDITARKQASAQLEDELAFSEERFRALFDQVLELTGILDPEGRVLAANRASLELIGKREDELIGVPFWDTPWWTEPGPRDQIRDAIGRAAAGELVRFQTTHLDADGRVHHIDFSLTPVRDADGRVVQLIPEGRDVTQLHDEHRRGEILASQLEQARKLESLGRLAGGIAHDFNNLLMVIRINAEEARHELPAAAAARPHVDAIIEAADATAQITRQLLTFSRGQSTGVGDVAVADLLAANARLLARLLRENVELQHEVAPGLWPARADHTQLQQAVLNLALNAQDAMPDGGRLTIGARNVVVDAAAAAAIVDGRAGDFVCVEVRDTGTGMDDATRARVFEPFFSTKGEGQGTGLGLAVVHGAVYGAGGFIAVVTAPGQGARFQLYVPRAPEVARAAVVAAAAPVAAPADAVIAVVEDQDALRRLIGRRLERQGFRVVTFANPAELLARAPTLAPAPALLLTDVVLPGMSGLELARAAIARWAGLRVLFMSGYTGDNPAVAAGGMAAHLLHKPFSPEELGQRVTRALGAPPWQEA